MARALFVSTQRVDENGPRMVRPFRGEKAFTDEVITPETALTVPGVLAAFTIISEDISSLPLLLYSQRGKNKFRAYEHPYYRLMKDQPNEEHSSMIFREIMMGHLLGWGNFYGQMVTDKRGEVVEIYPLRPDRMDVSRIDGEKIFTYNTIDNKKRVFTKDEILHIPAFGFDGLVGQSRIALMRNSIGLARAAENFGSKFFKNDARPGIVLKSKKRMDPDAQKNLRESFMDVYSGQENRWKVAVLEEDMGLETIGLPPEDAQFILTQNWTITQFARGFRIPLFMLGMTEGSSNWGSGIDSQEQWYVAHTLRPWTTRTEEALNLQILLKDEQREYFWEHLFADLLRGDLATRYEAYVKAINNGIMNPNEARSRENMNPYKGGDEYMRPANMVTVTSSQNQASEPGAQNALAPLWRDAINRVVKREVNDLNGAAKRHLAKGNVEAYQKWCANFYGKDHARFVQSQFQPVVEAQASLFDISLDLTEVIGQYVQMRQIAIEGMGVDEIVTNSEAWLQDLPDALLKKVLNIVQEAVIYE